MKRKAPAPLSAILLFFFNDTATTEIYTLSLHDALPISSRLVDDRTAPHRHPRLVGGARSEEHTSELQSRFDLVCRLLLEKKKNKDHSVLPIEHKHNRTKPNTNIQS